MKKKTKLQKQLEDITARKIAECYEQREEILKAFVAKYGYEPDECRQIESPIGYSVIRLDTKDAKVFREGLIREKIDKRFAGLSKWQRFCMWMARLA